MMSLSVIFVLLIEMEVHIPTKRALIYVKNMGQTVYEFSSVIVILVN